MIAESLLANEQTRLTELMISRSRVEEKGAIPLAEYFRTYDTLERLEIFQNAIKNESATLLTKSLQAHAEKGSLKYLDINDNTFNSAESVEALCILIKGATSLETLDISGLGIEDEDDQEAVKNAILESESKGSLQTLNWSYDAFERNKFVKECLELFSDRDQFAEIKEIQFAECIDKSKLRNKLRKEYKEKGVTLVLSDRQKDEDEKSSSSEDEDESDE